MSNRERELIERFIREAEATKLWGSIQLDFQDGQLSLIRREETVKVRTRTGNNRDDYQPRT